MKKAKSPVFETSIIAIAVLGIAFITLAFTSVYIKQPAYLQERFKIPTINNDEKNTNYCLAPEYMMRAWYHIEHVDSFCDTLNLKNKSKTNLQYLEFYKTPLTSSIDSFSNQGLVLIVDTINPLSMHKKPIWASYLFHDALDKDKKVLQDDTLVQEVSSFAIYLANMDRNKIANLRTQDGSAIMVLQAMDENKLWKDIEYWSNSWCGNSYFSLNIPPQHFAFTRGVKCSGDFETLCRLKLSNRYDQIYSNTFKMSISKKQFEKPKSKGE